MEISSKDMADLDYGIAASVRALIMAMAMQAENQHSVQCGNGVKYGEDAFLEVIDREGISHNAVVGRWR